MRPTRPFRVRAVLFDFDGTLTVPGILDFTAIRSALDCPPEEPVLEFIESLPDPRERARRYGVLEGFEEEAAATAVPAAGAEEAVRRTRNLGLKTGIITRNSRGSVERALQNFSAVSHDDFEVVVTRDDPGPPKPAPDGVLLAAERMGLPASQIVVVGDHYLDIHAGRDAGAVTVLVGHGPQNGRGQDGPPHGPPHERPRGTAARAPDLGGGEPTEPDFDIQNLGDLERVLRLGLPLPQGKLPNELLDGFLRTLPEPDPSLVIAPGVGEDVAIVSPHPQVEDEVQLLALKSDPITFTADRLAEYLIVVNANDIATSGADPRWLLSTVLVPPETTASEALALLGDVAAVCAEKSITLCGGHTEITDAVTRPVVVASLVGTVPRDRLIDKRKMAAGDRVLLTKQAGVEGTAVLAQELGRQLSAAGVPEETLAAARGFVDRLSIVPEARICAEEPGTTALHDVTEGGVATALSELSAAGGNRISIDIDRIPIDPVTRAVCDAVGADPLGLIGSGALLICCSEEACEALTDRITRAGIPVSVVGEVGEEGSEIRARRNGERVEWPRFERDEVARILDDRNSVARILENR